MPGPDTNLLSKMANYGREGILTTLAISMKTNKRRWSKTSARTFTRRWPTWPTFSPRTIFGQGGRGEWLTRRIISPAIFAVRLIR
jgi:hypothetical protein